MARCLKCDKQNREGARFCEECGARVTNPTTIVSVTAGAEGALICPVCRLQNAPHMNFCRRCGGKLPKSELRNTMQSAPFAGGATLGVLDPGSAGPPPPSVAVLMPPPGGPALAGVAAKQQCSSCGGSTPVGFAFCQLCGVKMEGAPAAVTAPLTSPFAPAALHPSPRRFDSPNPAVSRPTPIGVPSTAPQPSAGAATSLAKVRLVSIQRDGADGEAHEFVADQVALGRREGQVVFPGDPYLAERHTRIERRNDRWFVIDLGTRNGTFVRVSRPTVLGASEVLLVGKQVMAFDFLPSDPHSGPAAEEQGVLLFGTPVQPAWGRLRQLTMSGVARDVYYVSRPEVALGREDGDLLFPEDEFMSRCHLVLQHQVGVVTIVDQGSSNGTYLRVRGEREIADGEFIRLGDQLLRLEIA